MKPIKSIKENIWNQKYNFEYSKNKISLENNLKIFQLEYILDLVEKQDAVLILNQDKLIDSFNELLKYDLVEIQDGKILLTEKGEYAKKHGIHAYLQENPAILGSQDSMSEDRPQRRRYFWKLCFFGILTASLAIYILLQEFQGDPS